MNTLGFSYQLGGGNTKSSQTSGMTGHTGALTGMNVRGQSGDDVSALPYHIRA